MTLTIRDIRARPVMVPFKRPPASASGALPHAALVLVDLETEEGITGRSYLFGFGRWSLEPLVGCLLHMRDLLKGDRVAPVDMEAKLRARLTLIDTPGLVGLALAGVDMSAWDALAQAVAIATEELERREGLYRAGRAPFEVEGRTVILVDDGLATGASMRAKYLNQWLKSRCTIPQYCNAGGRPSRSRLPGGT